MSDTDGQVPLPDLNAADAPPVDDLAYNEDEQASRIAADLEAVFDVPVQVSAVLGRSKMDVGELLKLGPGTVLELCGDVAVVIWLLGSAAGESDAVASVHGPRLERLLEKLVDSPVRGFAYEAAGSVDDRHLAGGREIVERAGETWRIPVAVLTGGRDEQGWAGRSADAVAGLLAV